MPRVPAAVEPRYREAALPVVQQSSVASPELLATGARQQLQLGGALEEASNYAARIKQRTDADSVLAAENNLRASYIQFESETKKSRRGNQAQGVTTDADAWWQKEGDKAVATTNDPAQQRLLSKSIQRMRLQSIDSFRQFEDHQGEVAFDSNWKANKDLIINQGVSDPFAAAGLGPDGQPINASQRAIREIKARNAAYAAMKGLSAEAAQALDMQDMTRLHTEVITQLAQKDPTAAKDYYQKNKDQIAGTSYDSLNKLVDTASAANDGEKAADTIWQAAGPKSYNDPVLIDKMEAEVRKQYPEDAERRKVAISALRERAAAHNAAQAETKASAVNAVMAEYQRTRSLGALQKTPAWQALAPSDQVRIEEHITNVQTAALNRANAADARADAAEARAERRLARRGFAAYLAYSDPQQLSAMSENQVQALLPDLGQELTGKLMEKKRSMAKSGATLTASIDKDDFNNIATQMGLRPFEKNKSEDHAAQLGELQFRTEQLIDQAQNEAKRPLTRQEKREVMSREIARTVKVGGFFTDDDKPVITLTPKDLAKVVVPDDARKQIAEQMAARYEATRDPKYAPTDQNLRRWYAMGVSRSAKLIPDAK